MNPHTVILEYINIKISQFESNDPVLDWFDRPEQPVYKDKLFMLPILSLCILQDFDYRFINHEAPGFKVQLFWEGHKSLRNRPYGFDVY